MWSGQQEHFRNSPKTPILGFWQSKVLYQVCYQHVMSWIDCSDQSGEISIMDTKTANGYKDPLYFFRGCWYQRLALYSGLKRLHTILSVHF